MIKFIGRVYRWFWEDLLQRREPFTFQFRLIARAHPVLFWGTTGTIMVSAIGGFGFMIWFILHIIGIC